MLSRHCNSWRVLHIFGSVASRRRTGTLNSLLLSPVGPLQCQCYMKNLFKIFTKVSLTKKYLPGDDSPLTDSDEADLRALSLSIEKRLVGRDLASLNTALNSRGGVATNCVLYPSHEPREPHRFESPPQVVFFRVFRHWNVRTSSDLKRLPCCGHSCDDSRKVCINPYHHSAILVANRGKFSCSRLQERVICLVSETTFTVNLHRPIAAVPFVLVRRLRLSCLWFLCFTPSQRPLSAKACLQSILPAINQPAGPLQVRCALRDCWELCACRDRYMRLLWSAFSGCSGFISSWNETIYPGERARSKLADPSPDFTEGINIFLWTLERLRVC